MKHSTIVPNAYIIIIIISVITLNIVIIIVYYYYMEVFYRTFPGRALGVQK